MNFLHLGIYDCILTICQTTSSLFEVERIVAYEYLFRTLYTYEYRIQKFDILNFKDFSNYTAGQSHELFGSFIVVVPAIVSSFAESCKNTRNLKIFLEYSQNKRNWMYYYLFAFNSLEVNFWYSSNILNNATENKWTQLDVSVCFAKFGVILKNSDNLHWY